MVNSDNMTESRVTYETEPWLSTSIHLSVLPDCGCHVTSHPSLLSWFRLHTMDPLEL